MHPGVSLGVEGGDLFSFLNVKSTATIKCGRLLYFCRVHREQVPAVGGAGGRVARQKTVPNSKPGRA